MILKPFQNVLEYIGILIISLSGQIKSSESVTESKEELKTSAIFLFFNKVSSSSINIMVESPFPCLFEKYSLPLSQKGFELVAIFKFSKYYFLCFLLILTTRLRCFLYLDKSAGNWDLLVFFFRACLHETRSELKPGWNLKPLWKIFPFTWQFHYS